MVERNIEDCISLSVTDCKRLGFFIPGAIVRGSVVWSVNGTRIAEIGFATKLTGVPVAVLAYNYNGIQKDVTLQLRYYHSNLHPDSEHGYYYFVCPVTGRCCRKLYLKDGEFISRHALNLPYKVQRQSKAQRTGPYAFLRYVDRLERLTAQKYRRITYNGKPTPYGRMLERLFGQRGRFDIGELCGADF